MKVTDFQTEIKRILSELTLEEKIGMVHGAGLFRTEGVERLGIPPFRMSDGPMGVRAEFADDGWVNIGNADDYVTYLPCNSAVASTWNRKLAKEAGRALGEEVRGRGKDMILAPGINIKRSPLCGRNFEYMSEDPRLVEELAASMITGIQESDVAACVKHFAANSQETERLEVDTLADKRTLEEIYFPGFRAAVEKGNVLAVMGAYNRLNGVHCCTNNELLEKKLRGDWNFQGLVVSDWGGVHDTKQAAESGLDIEMDVTNQFSQYYMADPLLEKVRSGELDEALLDRKVEHILNVMFQLKMTGNQKEERKKGCYNNMGHRQAALEVAREAAILLKNEDNILPLDENEVKKIAVIGQNAAAVHSNGGGSAEIKALYEINILMGIKMLLGGNAEVYYAPGYVVPGKEEQRTVNWQAESTKKAKEESSKAQTDRKEQQDFMDSERDRYRKEALKLAEECDKVIFAGGLNHDFDVEGKDRKDMELPYGQNELLEELLEIRPDTVVVLYGGSPVSMPWIDRAKAVLWSYYAGMEGGTAIAETLFGRNNPGGKLAETFIREPGQCPAHKIGTFGRKDTVEYKEGIMVGYRYYDTEETDVLFPFGHGLSYTQFRYSDLTAETTAETAAAETACCRIRLKIKNTGKRGGKETVQIYVAPKASSVLRPVHELKAFDNVYLKPGEEKLLTFYLTERDFSYYNMEQDRFVVDGGEYEIQAGASSRDILLTCRFHMDAV